MQLPLITIITSTYNAVKELPVTLQSIKEQTYDNIQWIIVDGASSDGTVDLIRDNEDVIDFWLSEKDEGIYDAWNKALKHINGDWVFFLGAGDILYTEDTFKNISVHLINSFPKYNLVYGQVNVVDENDNIVVKWGEPWSEIENKWEIIRRALPPHPGSFMHSSFFKEKKYVFPKNLKIAGDCHLLLAAIMEKPPLYVPLIIDKMLFGGVSQDTNNLWKIFRELKIINKEFNIKPPIHIYIFNIIRICLKKIIYFSFSDKTNSFIMDNFRKQKLIFKNKK